MINRKSTMDNDMDNEMDQSLYHLSSDEEGYDSAGEITLEIGENKETHYFSVPYHPTHCKEKRLICFSIINKEPCYYSDHCTYAHSLEDQVIDLDKMYLYQLILDRNLMNFSSQHPKADDIYKQLLFLTHLCENCSQNRCTGGYNCRHGVFDKSLKLCRNDLLTGQCLNKIVEIVVDDKIIRKIKNISLPERYSGCINGHHLSERNLVPYYKFLHQKENNKKSEYQSVRYIDINSISRIFRNTGNNVLNDSSDDSKSDSSDEEISSWFKKIENEDLLDVA